MAKKFPEVNYPTRPIGGGSLMIWGASHLRENLNYKLSGVDKKQQII